MSIKIKELPEGERPYEKMQMYGEKALSNAELLAIIIKTGTKEETSVGLAQRILSKNTNKNIDELNFLREMSIEEFMEIKGIGKVKAIQLKAICELATRMSRPTNYRQIQITNPRSLANYMMEEMKFLRKEKLKVIILNTKNVIQKIEEVSTGGTNSINVKAKEIFAEAIKMQMPKIILVHNHPSGDSTPSKADIDFTLKMQKASEIIGIELIDHIVIGNDQYTSIYQEIMNNKR